MTRDLTYQAELAHDTAGLDAGPFMQAALDSIVDDLMTTGKARGLRWGLQDFLEDQADLAELVSAAITTRNAYPLHATIERRLRRELEDSDAVFDLAAQLAAEKPEES